MKTLIISPSGNFYGSERVLLDYLTVSPGEKIVAVNKNGILKDRLFALKSKIRTTLFDPNRIKLFYCKVFFKLLFNRVDCIYLNEAGHINYCLILAKLFRKKKFVIHVRIVEDTIVDRWIFSPTPNCFFVAVSDYIRKKFPYTAEVIYDPYVGSQNGIKMAIPDSAGEFVVGIVGRVTFTKGVELLTDIIAMIESQCGTAKYKFVFYGDISPDVKYSSWFEDFQSKQCVVFAGFYDDPVKIYSNLHCVLHLSEQEALGRVFLEAISHLRPFIGLRSGGIGELGELLGLESYLAVNNDHKAELIFSILEKIRNNYRVAINDILTAKTKLDTIFSVNSYVSKVDAILSR